MRNVLILGLVAGFAAGAAWAGSETQPAKSEKSTKSEKAEKAGKAGTKAEKALKEGSTLLDGTRWDVKVTPDQGARTKGEQTFDDTLVFDQAKVEMTACVKMGFAATPYEAEAKGAKTEFEAEQKSSDHGSTQWTGLVKGDSIEGALLWKKPDGSTFHYFFSGKRAAAAAK